MKKATYIDQRTRETVRGQSISYIAADVPPGRALDGYGRINRTRAQRYSSTLRRIARRAGAVGSTETTAGGW